MKRSTDPALTSGAGEKATEPQGLHLDLPSKIGPDNVEAVIATLCGSVPTIVGPDPMVQRQDRLVIQGIYRVVLAAKDYLPEKEWDRQSPYDVKVESVINARLKASGSSAKARVQKNSPLETRIARCVYPDRRRAHVASMVIRAAMAKGVGPDKLLDFIAESNGTENIRRKTTPASKGDALSLMWSTKPLLTISLPREIVGGQTPDMPKTMLFTVRRTGEVDIRWVGDNSATARSALAAFVKDALIRSVVSHDAPAGNVHKEAVQPA